MSSVLCPWSTGWVTVSELVKIHSQKIAHRFAYGVEGRGCSFSFLISRACQDRDGAVLELKVRCSTPAPVMLGPGYTLGGWVPLESTWLCCKLVLPVGLSSQNAGTGIWHPIPQGSALDTWLWIIGPGRGGSQCQNQFALHARLCFSVSAP